MVDLFNGTVENEIFAYVTDDQNNNVSSFYEFIYVAGKLTILSNTFL